MSYINSQLEHYSLTIYSFLTIQKAIWGRVIFQSKYSNKSYLKIHIYWRNLSKETIKIQNYDKDMSKWCCTVCLTLLLHLFKIKIYEIWLSAILKHLFDLIDQFKVVFVKSAYFLRLSAPFSIDTNFARPNYNCLFQAFFLFKTIKQLWIDH